MKNFLKSLVKYIRQIYNLPGLSKIFDQLALSYLKGKAASSKNTIDDKLVKVIEAALNNKNYRAVMNGKAKA